MSIEKNTPSILRHSGLSFTTILNQTMDLIKDAGALGIYCYLASKPSGWKIYQKEIGKRFSVGKDYVTKRFDHLKKIGLLKITAVRDEVGKISYWETTLFNVVHPDPENPYSGQENTPSEPDPENPESGKPAPINKRLLEIKDLNINNITNAHLIKKESRFDQFWQEYPNKVAKKRTKEIWDKEKLDNKADEIIKAVKLSKENNPRWLNQQFIPDPTKYLHQERWNDEIIKSTTNGGSNNGAVKHGQDVFNHLQSIIDRESISEFPDPVREEVCRELSHSIDY